MYLGGTVDEKLEAVLQEVLQRKTFLNKSLSNLLDMGYPREKLCYFEVSFLTEI